MTSGKFAYVPVSSIIVNRDERQRRELEGIEELAKSILDNGLINPIVVTQDFVLVAGERRLTAHKHLGFEQIAVQFAEDLSQTELHLIELEENIRREELPWQDHVKAIARYHELQESIAKEESRSWSQEQTAKSLNMSQANVAKHLMVKKAMDEGVKEVLEAPKLSTAANFTQRMQERRKSSALRELKLDASPEPVKAAPSAAEPVSAPVEQASTELYAEILNTNFLEWAKTVQETPYNFIHCDFPYGINAGDTKGWSGAKSFGGYEDKPDVYFELLEGLIKYQDRFIAPSAHLIFWFSMTFYQDTLIKLREAGWKVNEFPLIWHRSDNSGIMPDPQRGPRRTYETAFFASRGDRKVVKPVANSLAAATTKVYHMSEKPIQVLEHFFRMTVDETTVMLDPTCGSGNAVKVAEAAGANWATGIELNPDYAESARQNLGL